MISEKMSKLLERSAAMSSMYTESARLKEKYGAENVYDFGMGNPNLPAPDSIRETSIRVLQETDPWYLHHYMPNNGFPEAREKIAASLNRRFGEHFDANNIMMCTGAAGGLNCLLKVLMDPGQEILTFAPYFGEYDRYADNVGCTLTTVPPNIPTFQPDPAALEKCVTEKTRAVLIDNPNNPTGVVYNEETIRAIAAVLAKKEQEYGHAIYLISDEPYRELVFDGASVPWIPNDYKNTIVAYSFSKSLSLPGERIGYLAVNPACPYAAEIVNMCGQISRGIGHNCPSSLMQLAVSKVLDLTSDFSVYEKNRNLLYECLTDCGFEVVKPEGTFYIFPKAPEADAAVFCQKALQYDLVLVPADSFGCPGYFRMAYCIDTEKVERSLPVLRKMMKEIYG